MADRVGQRTKIEFRPMQRLAQVAGLPRAGSKLKRQLLASSSSLAYHGNRGPHRCDLAIHPFGSQAAAGDLKPPSAL
jgi:hypothetical protein